ncbi:MAG: hypothetical protein UW46_C0004G0036 [Candidatus Yanofskybacteria bacterium GW2011_GWF1_44_227]|uniref:VRR-NUC domain-containing protein n=1 Tax=Candidatus Yanofskybacteria bacterium GW2011_GWE2_40_11 TaxID=1619033 RepID=A0A0G0TRS5_9BACT|nr:MAG: hypothetical protein UT75_C0007G0010 [Candidatus Yanofskybacteria bacterium GW2011_GWE2_40_11]KKT15642.1 MAG: hypothetical protein UV97_C0004G0058 [Candidatus Yanofskybacteria bacterium GW2011_GWF2_43_596]KKT53309.1 MAG: hypothetical protein UW46_C0004G0036 [Candidatus Yanofskybacteria bacterium GW2011_GWF1_44_227]OGN35941.1 MAG: hypothetical protein A2207_02675 [Candidatus Yanofskybacteria bacterium RIFOXYA1_FULL_44_17]OGN36457.1 MAG: hypothetical protein A2241_01810 [Candidatus Yanofs
MHNNIQPKGDALGFLDSYPSDKETIILPSGSSVEVKKYILKFKAWQGDKPVFDFGRKPIIDFDGEGCFAELAILRMFLKNGWQGVWVEAYGGTHFLNSMPTSWSLKPEHISIPEEKEKLLKRIWMAGKTKACFDVVVWQDDKILFCEAKRSKKDRLTKAQEKFIQGVITCGIPLSALIIIEWDFQP